MTIRSQIRLSFTVEEPASYTYDPVVAQAFITAARAKVEQLLTGVAQQDRDRAFAEVSEDADFPTVGRIRETILARLDMLRPAQLGIGSLENDPIPYLYKIDECCHTYRLLDMSKPEPQRGIQITTGMGGVPNATLLCSLDFRQE